MLFEIIAGPLSLEMFPQYTTWYGPWGEKEEGKGEKNATATEHKNLNLNLAD